MVAVFAGFASGKLVMFEQMGFGLGVAILLDATLVRMLLVPSAMSLLGKANWYLPRWLEWLPRLTIESTPMPLPAVGGTDRSVGGNAGASRAPIATDSEGGSETPPEIEPGRAA
jgi:uncharacterized membrane protein YdfJ with MMPL/SSD domain